MRKVLHSVREHHGPNVLDTARNIVAEQRCGDRAERGANEVHEDVCLVRTIEREQSDEDRQPARSIPRQAALRGHR